MKKNTELIKCGSLSCVPEPRASSAFLNDQEAKSQFHQVCGDRLLGQWRGTPVFQGYLR